MRIQEMALKVLAFAAILVHRLWLLLEEPVSM